MGVICGGCNVVVMDVQLCLICVGIGVQGVIVVLLIVLDFNGDGVLDLQVWQDNSGVYNVLVYVFYLFDFKCNCYVCVKVLEVVIGGCDIDYIDNGWFVFCVKVSLCECEDKVIELCGIELCMLLQCCYDICRGEVFIELDLLKQVFFDEWMCFGIGELKDE